jgi:hypothetical protein
MLWLWQTFRLPNPAYPFLTSFTFTLSLYQRQPKFFTAVGGLVVSDFSVVDPLLFTAQLYRWDSANRAVVGPPLFDSGTLELPLLRPNGLDTADVSVPVYLTAPLLPRT